MRAQSAQQTQTQWDIATIKILSTIKETLSLHTAELHFLQMPWKHLPCQMALFSILNTHSESQQGSSRRRRWLGCRPPACPSPHSRPPRKWSHRAENGLTSGPGRWGDLQSLPAPKKRANDLKMCNTFITFKLRLQLRLTLLSHTKGNLVWASTPSAYVIWKADRFKMVTYWSQFMLITI